MTNYANPVAGEATAAKLQTEWERILGLGLTAHQLAHLAAYADPGAITSEATPEAALRFYGTCDPEEVKDGAAEHLAWLNLFGRANSAGARIASRAMDSADREISDNRAGGVSSAAVPVLGELLELFDGWADDHPDAGIADVHVLRDALRRAYDAAVALDEASKAEIRRRVGEQHKS
jgi:hypothetical protein